MKSVLKKIMMLSMAGILAAAPAVTMAAELKPVVKGISTEDMDKSIEQSADEEAEEMTALYTPEEFKWQGVIQHDGYRWTYYSERVLPGPGLQIPGRYTDELGYVCDENDFIVVASRDLERGTEIDTPFGKKGKVYDWCAIHGTLDIYTNW
ncbi:MAG: hypothetical protein KBT01_02305 [Clostridiales bacterium]|nr:hypothetical protein [Candidatus Blautia equi]